MPVSGAIKICARQETSDAQNDSAFIYSHIVLGVRCIAMMAFTIEGQPAAMPTPFLCKILRHAIRIIIHNNFLVFFPSAFRLQYPKRITFIRRIYKQALVCVCARCCVSIFQDAGAAAVRTRCAAIAVKFMIRRKF